MAERIQMTRQKPWRADHPGAIVVARPSRWGNPFVVRRDGDEWVVAEDGFSAREWDRRPTKAEAMARAVDLYELHTGPMGNYEFDVDQVRRELGGRDLACWCAVGSPCHADFLLAVANGGTL